MKESCNYLDKHRYLHVQRCYPRDQVASGFAELTSARDGYLAGG